MQVVVHYPLSLQKNIINQNLPFLLSTFQDPGTQTVSRQEGITEPVESWNGVTQDEDWASHYGSHQPHVVINI